MLLTDSFSATIADFQFHTNPLFKESIQFHKVTFWPKHERPAPGLLTIKIIMTDITNDNLLLALQCFQARHGSAPGYINLYTNNCPWRPLWTIVDFWQYYTWQIFTLGGLLNYSFHNQSTCQLYSGHQLTTSHFQVENLGLPNSALCWQTDGAVCT